MLRASVPPLRNAEQIFVSTLPGLEPVLMREAAGLGGEARAVEGGVEIAGEAGLHQEANLRLRTASRVLLRLARFPAQGEQALARGLAGVDVRPFWDGRSRGQLSLAARKSRVIRLESVFSAAERAWPFLSLCRAGSLDEAGGGELSLFLRLEGEVCTVSVDTSGDALHRRGYRQEVSRAPLRETLAAGILMLAGYDGAEPLYDPMCGSGTFLIEGAWMSARRAPGLERTFAFERSAAFDAGEWAARREGARAEALGSPRGVQRGWDVNAGALGTARRNARRAGVTLALERKDIAAHAALPPGLVVVNPPYGKRVGEAEDLPELYRALGEALRGPFAGSRMALLMPQDRALLKALAVETASTLPLRNGGIPCWLVRR